MLARMGHVLYAIHGSHPCATVEKALELKRQPYRRFELAPAFHVPYMWLRFRRRTVPTLVLGSGEAIVGSREILRRLDQIVPAPALYPADAEARHRVEEAERWGDEVLQAAARRMFWMGIKRAPEAIASYSAGSKLPVPSFVQPFVARPMGAAARWNNRTDEDVLRADLAALPERIAKVEGLIADGVLGGEQLNAADLQIASSVRMLATFADLRPLLEGPALELALRAFPQYDGAMPAGTYDAPARPAAALSA